MENKANIVLLIFILLTSILTSCQWNPPEYGLLWIDDNDNQGPGTGNYNVGVVPTRWKFRYRDSSHHIASIRLMHRFLGFDKGDGWVTWESNACLVDKNKDDPYNCFAQYAIFAIPNSFMKYFSSNTMQTFSNALASNIDQSYNDETLKGFSTATVILTGWRLGFWEKDHHIEKIAVKISDVNYNSNNGNITWKVNSIFEDKNFYKHYNYIWSYNYLIIALNENVGTITQKTISNYYTDEDNELIMLRDSLMNKYVSSLKSSDEYYVVLPQGWEFELPPNSKWYEEFNTSTYCKAKDGDIEVRHIALNMKAWVDHRSIYCNAGVRLGPYHVWCSSGSKEMENAYRYTRRIPFYKIDIASITWKGGGNAKYPPEDWLNNDAGWRCDWDNWYFNRIWRYNLAPPEFDSW